MSGSLTTTPLGSRMRPIGRVSASSPRSALARRPAVSRLRIVCSSSSDIDPFKTEEETPVGATRIIYAVAIGDEAAMQATNVQQRIPVGTVARQTRHVD